MKLYCKHCKKVLYRDMRTNACKSMMSKRGYKSFCWEANKYVYLNKIK